MNIFKEVHQEVNEVDRLMEEIETLMPEVESILAEEAKKFSIMEISYTPSGDVEWNPEQAKPKPGQGGGITRDTSAGVERRQRMESMPKVGDVVLTTNEQGQVLPVVLSNVENNIGIVENKHVQLRKKIDVTKLRQAQGEIAKRFQAKYPNKKFWQVAA